MFMPIKLNEVKLNHLILIFATLKCDYHNKHMKYAQVIINQQVNITERMIYYIYIT